MTSGGGQVRGSRVDRPQLPKGNAASRSVGRDVPARYNLVLIDDRVLVRDAFRCLVERGEKSVRVLEADAAAGIEDILPAGDTVVFFTQARRVGGFCAAADQLPELLRAVPTAKPVLLCPCEAASCMRDAVQKGARGFVSLHTGAEVMCQILRVVAAGGTSIPVAALLNGDAPPAGPAADERAPLATLTARQRRVLDLMCQGYSNRIIAEKLQQTEGTIKGHVFQILRKLGVKNRTEAVLLALPQVRAESSDD